MENVYARNDKENVARLQTYKCQFELIQMEEKETINYYVTRIMQLVNHIKSRREAVYEQNVMLKILRTLTVGFHNIMVAIEESKDLDVSEISSIRCFE